VLLRRVVQCIACFTCSIVSGPSTYLLDTTTTTTASVGSAIHQVLKGAAGALRALFDWRKAAASIALEKKLCSGDTRTSGGLLGSSKWSSLRPQQQQTVDGIHFELPRPILAVHVHVVAQRARHVAACTSAKLGGGL
jgi:hypothetical protein